MPSPSSKLVEKRNALDDKRRKLAKVFDEAADGRHEDGRDYDFAKVTSLKGSAREILEQVRKMDAEINDLKDEVDAMAAAEDMAGKYQDEHLKNEPGGERRFQRVDAPDDLGGEPKGWGDLFVESDAYKQYRRGKGLKAFADIKADPTPLIKTTFETSAGWAPESIRIGRMVESAQRPIEVIDIIPGGRTTQAAIVYMAETTFTNNADFRSENAAYAENAFALTERSVTVRSIGASLPVTDEQMADVEQVRSYLNNRMGFSVRQQLDAMILTATGVAPEWTGINNFSSIQTQALGADSVPDAIYKALDLVRYTGRATPSNVVIHPNDWQPVRLLRTADGIYIWGNPSEAGPMRIWGLPVLVTTAQTENTGLVGDFRTFCQYFVRQDMAIEMGFVNDDFLDGRVTIRAGIRGALVGYRDTAFCQVTGL